MDCVIRVISGPELGLEHKVQQGAHVIGRGNKAALRLTPEDVSWEHALVTREGDDYFVENLSSQGTWIGDSKVAGYIINSVIIAACTTLASVLLGSLAAYGFSRFRIAGSNDMQFFILSTRMLPAMAVSVPILWMFSRMRLDDSFNVNRVDVSATAAFWGFTGKTRYFKVAKNAAGEEDEGITWDGAYKISQHFSAFARQARNTSR